MKLELIEPLAQDVMQVLAVGCARIIIAGSIRRRKAEPNDIELVAIPNVGTYEVRDLFGESIKTHTVNRLEDEIGVLIDSENWEFDPITRRNGPAYKRLRHVESGTCCDLFITDRRKWGVIATIRTGPGDFSKELVSLAHQRGMFVQVGLLHGHPPIFAQGKVQPCPSGEKCPQIIETPEEADFFRALGLPWVDVDKRAAGRVLDGRTWDEVPQ